MLSTLSGWIALGLNLWKQRREKTILEFTISATYAEADHDEIPNTSFEGTPYVHALSVDHKYWTAAHYHLEDKMQMVKN